jgi:hypothetical protein
MKKELRKFDFYSKMGFEFSILPTNEYSEDAEEEMVEKLLCKKEVNGFPRTHLDNGSIEINSPVFDNSDAALKFFDKIDAVRDKLGLKFWDENEMNGGLHVHINLVGNSIPEKLRFLNFMYKFITNAPFLNWVFNDPNDDINAMSFLSGSKWTDSIKFLKKIDGKKFMDLNALDDLDSIKEFAVRYDKEYETVELRFFDMVKDRNEFYLIMDFVDRLTEGIHKASCDWSLRDYKINFDAVKQFRVSPIEDSIDEFNLLLTKLSLNPKDYKVFIDRNLRPRFDFGKKYLT